MAVAGLTVSANASANNIAVTGALRSGTQPHGNTVTVSRAGEQTTGDTTSTAYTITTQNSISGVTANVTQQTGFSSTIDGSDNLISYASIAGQGVNFHAASPDNVAYTATQSTSTNNTPAPAATDTTNSPVNVAAASTNTPLPSAPPSASANVQAQTLAVQATASRAPANANPSAPPPIASYSNTSSAPTQTSSAPSAPPSTPSNSNNGNSGSNQDTGSGGYTALANASASTIRGGTLNVVT